MMTLDVLFTPADFEAFAASNPKDRTCVVFDILRATSTMVTALNQGAAKVIPALSIEEALRLREAHPGALLAGERNGFRILKDLTGSIDFDLGNSPREFMTPAIQDRAIIMTTTNGTRALRACCGARKILAAAFLNVRATAAHLKKCSQGGVVLVCSGTAEQAAYEDVLGAGALTHLLWETLVPSQISDAAWMARQLFLQQQHHMEAALAQSRNGQRLMTYPELRPDIAFCARQDCYNTIAEMNPDGVITLPD